jgi:hypothetical protein
MAFDQSDWDSIYKGLYDGTLIPILSRELTTIAVAPGEAPIPFELRLARRFAAGEPEPIEIRGNASAASFYARYRRYYCHLLGGLKPPPSGGSFSRGLERAW